MKITVLTQRRSRCRKSPTISLFPFLAVLICTMGALVPLLLAIARQARLQAFQEATVKAAQRQVDVQSEQELAEWRIGELKTSRKQAEEQLTQARLALGHVENHARRLREQGDQLQATLENLNKTGTQTGRQRAELEGELKQVRSQISQAEKQFAAAQQEAAGRPRSYAVIPYQGPHGTYRQPIYVECRADAIVLQPDGIALVEADFDEPLEAGNPLDRALRAAREVLLAQKRIKGDGSDEPYPLLLVRPNGIPAYYVARTALKSWRSAVGYELVGKDWELEFPRADPEVGRAVRGVVAEAREQRRRQAVLVAMLANAKSPAGYRAAFGSGLMGGQGAGGAPGSPGPSGAMAGASAGRSGGAMATGKSGGAGSGGSSGSQLAGGIASGSLAGSGSPSASGFGAGSGNASSAGPSAKAASRPDGAAKGPSLSPDGTMATAIFGELKPARRDSRVTYRAAPGGGLIQEIEPDDSSTPSSSLRRGGFSSGGRHGNGSAPPGGVARAAGASSQGASAGEASAASGPGAKAASQGVALRPGEWIPQEAKSPPQPEAKERPDGKSKRLADSRGDNWGLPNAARGSVGITRPIRVRCSSNRLELLPDDAEEDRKAIPLGERTEDSVDDFVSAVWEHMKTWGIAGRGMYWRPILRIEVTPDAEFRYAELKALLDNSGLIVERKIEERKM